MLIPEENVKDLVEIGDDIKNRLEIHPVRWIEQVLEYALERQPGTPAEEAAVPPEPRSPPPPVDEPALVIKHQRARGTRPRIALRKDGGLRVARLHGAARSRYRLQLSRTHVASRRNTPNEHTSVAARCAGAASNEIDQRQYARERLRAAGDVA